MTFEVQPIPNASDKPSVSQSQIKQNFENLKSWAAVDHLTYGVTNNGTHTKMSIISPSTPTVPVLQESVTFTKLGIADTGSTNLHFQNKNATFQLNPIRAWAYIQNPGATAIGMDVPFTQGVNIDRVNRRTELIYDVFLTSGTVSSAIYSALAFNAESTGSNGSVLGISGLTNSQFSLNRVNTGTISFSVLVLQI